MSYRPPWPLTNPHLNTVVAAFLPAPTGVWQRRVRCELRDGDFLDLDYCGELSGRPVALLIHGLEGSSHSSYIRSLADALRTKGISSVGMNLRGCGGELNRKPYLYHSGMIEDVADAVRSIEQQGAESIVVIGFSLGANLTLNYLARDASVAHSRVRAGVAVAAPCDVAASADALDRKRCRIYRRFFFRLLRRKLETKLAQFPGLLSLQGYREIDSFWEYDDRYTAPLHGFGSVAEFYRAVSSRPHLQRIQLPTLMLGAHDDPFLGETCFPRAEVLGSSSVCTDFDAHGGHVASVERDGLYLRRGLEGRILSFLGSVRPDASVS